MLSMDYYVCSTRGQLLYAASISYRLLRPMPYAVLCTGGLSEATVAKVMSTQSRVHETPKP